MKNGIIFLGVGAYNVWNSYNMKKYWEKYIKPRGLRNRQLEEFFEVL